MMTRPNGALARLRMHRQTAYVLLSVDLSSIDNRSSERQQASRERVGGLKAHYSRSVSHQAMVHDIDADQTASSAVRATAAAQQRHSDVNNAASCAYFRQTWILLS